MYHFLKRYIFQNNFSSPIEDKLIKGGCKVLDARSGTGTWLLDLSNKYENSYFFGVENIPLYPQEIKPNNLEFIDANVTKGLSFHDNEFDFTHLENMGLVLTPDQWDFVLSELIRVTKPGGYIEVSDRRNSNNGEGPILRKVSEAFWATRSKQNVDFKLIYNLDSKFELQPNIGKVHRIEKDLIMGPNGGKAGLVMQDISISFYASELAVKSLSKEIGISEEEYKNMAEKDLIEEYKQTSPVITHVRFWAQKQLSQ
ncbi:uncharacterized protein OCT59_020322 [Rhizophagus irregularis]|uniref:Methyltransferase domain-containing protein n=2 Tax=Rhizophagus irregularis TaxID=588596 RepID=A0A2H5S6R4_RHIID|nr:hypothetical protein GLOIN_2v350735 [Rhizophagus irregularis DAOM 181602=DAOM 197198]POG80230.1 hypothetical protein GLOIN_2v350735 [Rhizophagus irregularis DAOM 181602=DAOM 197198]UZO01811.1 hypothetical protein OCT59_020322 [Rhizophagus irregularis]GBC26018.1 S-adenosyl-L-methionine-dependent methyltransferase [Rhizophagus irregularis DAOM 181602=DAOM 197198]|eukprot:XP_025187096.1 hypothetical protein GLOIN_2v350735 [Rhizophagus irregularis DAOM 181602=DAOM 197198]